MKLPAACESAKVRFSLNGTGPSSRLWKALPSIPGMPSGQGRMVPWASFSKIIHGISLGPNSRLELKEFVFKPAIRQFSMVNRLAKGVASFVSGKMTKLSPEAVVLETPQSVIGVRGTTYNIKVD